MAEALRTWILGVTGAAMIASICLSITPESKVKKVVALCCSLAVILMLVRPVIGFDYGSFAREYAQFRAEAADFLYDVAAFNEKLHGLIIEQACSAYILDKGTQLGIHDLRVEVSARQSADGYWYPFAARLWTAADQELRDQLQRIIVRELGIPPEELVWSVNYER